MPLPAIGVAGVLVPCMELITIDGNNAERYDNRVIQTFAENDTERVWQRVHVRKVGPDLQRIANRKLLILDAAETINDLRVPPGNRLADPGREVLYANEDITVEVASPGHC